MMRNCPCFNNLVLLSSVYYQFNNLVLLSSVYYKFNNLVLLSSVYYQFNNLYFFIVTLPSAVCCSIPGDQSI